MSPHHAGAPVPGASLPRLLARLQGREPALQPRSPADVLGGWLEWQRAVALSRALDEAPAMPEGPAHGVGADNAASDSSDGGSHGSDGGGLGSGSDGSSHGTSHGSSRASAGPDPDAALTAECRRLRSTLEAAIRDDGRDWTLPLRPRAGGDGTGLAAGVTAVQRHCQGLQRDLQAATGRLRGELRERLACRAGVQARLAAVDAVMEGLLAPREHALLVPLVPAVVARFEQLHARHDDADSPLPGAEPAPWRAAFRSEARQLLLAELDLRFHPIEALLAALHSPKPDA